MATYVSHGSSGHIEELNMLYEENHIGQWTVNRNAKIGDTLVFYIRRPVSSFVAIGRVRSDPFKSDDEWHGKYLADVAVEYISKPWLKRLDACDQFPDWRWLKAPQAPTRVPDDVALRLLELLGGEAAEGVGIGDVRTGAGFGIDSERNKTVEDAAIHAVVSLFSRRGWIVEDCQGENCGFDLRCRKGAKEQHVEVKGVFGGELQFIITANELRVAEHDPCFKLVIVTNAVSASERVIHEYSWNELIKKFAIQALAFKVRQRAGRATYRPPDQHGEGASKSVYRRRRSESRT